jgi:hypothetical protein
MNSFGNINNSKTNSPYRNKKLMAKSLTGLPKKGCKVNATARPQTTVVGFVASEGGGGRRYTKLSRVVWGRF